LLFALALTACDPAPDDPDGGSCALTVEIGTGDVASFAPVADGDPAELLLGFQGFRMLRFALLVDGAGANEAEVSAFASLPGSGVELSQRTRETDLTATGGGFVIEEWLLFFNDEPPSRVVGHEAEVEVIVRAGGCVGGARATVVVRDEDDCVDHGIVLDAGAADTDLADASACGEAP
jgi:hypothetical protein